MFQARQTKYGNAPPEAIRRYLLLEQLEGAESESVRLFAARNRESGHRVILKCGDGSPEAADRMRHEAEVLSGLEHPHVVALVDDHSSDDQPYVAFAWAGERPLSAQVLAELASFERSQVAHSLLATIVELQQLASPVVHGRLALQRIWLSPAVRCPVLLGFEEASCPASAEQLQAERTQTVELVQQLLEPIAGDNESLVAAGEAWIEGGTGRVEGFTEELHRRALTGITQDL